MSRTFIDFFTLFLYPPLLFSSYFFIFFPLFFLTRLSPKQSTFLYLFNNLVHELHCKYLPLQPVIHVVGSHFFCFCIQPKLKHLLAYLSVCTSALSLCLSVFVWMSKQYYPGGLTDLHQQWTAENGSTLQWPFLQKQF